MKRWGDSGTERLQRTIGVAHAEAFQLMLYRNEYRQDGSGRIKVADGAELWFWNSRDGVTPFGCTVDELEYTHAMHGYPTRFTAVLPPEAQMVWVDYTPGAWRDMLHRRWVRFMESEKTEWHDPDEFSKQFPTAESFEIVQPYRPGEPMSLTREEFLETTHSWHGRKSDEAEAA